MGLKLTEEDLKNILHCIDITIEFTNPVEDFADSLSDTDFKIREKLKKLKSKA